MNLRTVALVGLIAISAAACGKASSPAPWKPGAPVPVNVGGAFAAGTVLRDAYGGSSVTVDGAGNVAVLPGPSGVALLEKDGAAAMPFSWGNASVYFALTDRFNNGDGSNDNIYKTRGPDGAENIGTWHGGDWRGLTQKLDYLKALGVDALWISPIVEQVHGWVGGGNNGEFKHFAYAGYWALDFTTLDANWGSKQDLHDLIDGAHSRGIRVLVDVVMNHPGYATGDDLVSYLPSVIIGGPDSIHNLQPNPPSGNSSNKNPGWQSFNDFINYHSADWVDWWSPKWIRAGFPAPFDQPGNDDLTRSVGSLPDFKTEATAAADKPVLFQRKADSAFLEQPGFTVRQYLVKWHTDWVREFGIDGFRCDTALNVEVGSWAALKAAATSALADWKAANPSKKIDDAPFWMTGEVYGHGVEKDAYFYDGKFDSLINFGFSGSLASTLAYNATLLDGVSDVEKLYASMSNSLAGDQAFTALSYLSSHDTRLIYADLKYDPAKQKQAGSALVLAPGAVQIFYGDESGRKLGPATGDPTQGVRSDMNWATTDSGILAHFQALLAFRKRHAAIGEGVHLMLGSPAGSYAFSRKLDQGSTHDAVVVVMVPPT